MNESPAEAEAKYKVGVGRTAIIPKMKKAFFIVYFKSFQYFKKNMLPKGES